MGWIMGPGEMLRLSDFEQLSTVFGKFSRDADTAWELYFHCMLRDKQDISRVQLADCVT